MNDLAFALDRPANRPYRPGGLLAIEIAGTHRNRSILYLSLDAYPALLNWTGRQLLAEKRGAIPSELRPILQWLSIHADAWVDTMLDFGQRFRRVIGRAASIAALARRRGRHWFQGQSAGRAAFI